MKTTQKYVIVDRALTSYKYLISGGVKGPTVDSVELLRIATALDPRYKALGYLSPEEKDLTWTVIQEQVSNSLATDIAQCAADHESESDTVCEPVNKRLRLMDTDSDDEERDHVR